jgi:hypothetical protein
MRLEVAPRRGLFRRIVYWLTRRKVGKVATPVQLAAHNGAVLFGYGMFEYGLDKARRAPAGLKALAQLRVAGLVGCPF